MKDRPAPWQWGEGRPLKPSPLGTARSSLPDYVRYLRRMAKDNPEWATLADEAERYLDLRSLI